MKTIAVGEFKSHCLSLFERVRAKKEKIIIARWGKPIAQVLPLGGDLNVDVREQLKNTLVFEGDILSPIDEVWEATQ
ncbi:MAG: hypothetical protein A2048_07560 [Deltaproteobacteria bacterium GWA2_45_12]|nr:MAG: hypothetical protein A2048_07560 [Deltaproteobacteria bacterium GWA2_45_12]